MGGLAAGTCGAADGRARLVAASDHARLVATITVTEAHTYVSAGVLSHNIKAGGPGGN